MSGNYRIILHFLSTIDDTVNILLGLRGNPHLYSQIKKSLIEQTKNNVNQFKNINNNSGLNELKNINPIKIIDDTKLIAEGLRQYTEYKIKHSINSNYNNQKLIENQQINQQNLINQNEKTTTTKFLIKNEKKFRKTNQIEEDKKIINENLFRNKINENENKKNLNEIMLLNKLSEKSRERKVPSNRLSRILSFSQLAVSMSYGAMEELAKRTINSNDNDNNNGIMTKNLFLTKTNAEKIVNTLCTVRGAALKLGQMLSLQDNELLGQDIQQIFERVRQSADYMPEKQLISMLKQELGDNWRENFVEFSMKPFAAASIGQVHHAKIIDNQNNVINVAVKIQYPGVAESIDSDIKNVLTIIKYANIFPEGLFIDHIMQYAKKELSWEVDYLRESECQIKYSNVIKKYTKPEENIYVPKVYEKCLTKKLLTTELIYGIPIDKLDNFMETSNENIKNSIIERILRLFFRELFLFNYMQTDPNWSNFFYDFNTDRISLIDFGNCRTFSEEFVRKYQEIIEAAIDNDRKSILDKSLEIGFLTGYETELFKNSHIDSVLIIGEVLRISDRFNFGKQSVIKRINDQLPIMLKYRLKPPPEEIYSLHRKLSGLFLLCCKLKVNINCRKIYDDIVEQMNKNF